jgi:hypothetical protein
LYFVNKNLYADVTDEQKHAATARRVEIFVLVKRIAGSTQSRVLLGPEVALIVDSLATHAALVVFAIGRSVRRGAVLPGGIVFGRRGRSGLRAGGLGRFGARFALG